MLLLEPHINRFVREATALFGATPAVATVHQESTWIHRLGPLAVEAGTGTWTAALDANSDSVHPRDWHGVLDLWTDTSHRVLIRRIPLLTQYNDTAAITIVAARTQDDIARAVLHGRSLYREWRRSSARVRDARERDVDVVPVRWEQLYLPSPFLEEIRSNVLHFAGARALYDRLGLPYRRGLLFYGPPGNGKTMLCRAIVTALGWPVVYVSPHSRSETSVELQRAFCDAADLAPSVLWIDDVDALFDGDAAISSFLNRLDGASTVDGMLVLATTNHPERLDPAIVARPSRFDRIFELAPPASGERDRFFSDRFGSQLSADTRADLVRRTSGMSMAFIQEVFVGAALRALQRGEVANDSDACHVLDALLRHVRTTDQAFEDSGPTGFARRRD